jgi:hypothetical protein
LAVKTENATFGPQPEKSSSILKEDPYRQAGETVLGSVVRRLCTAEPA